MSEQACCLGCLISRQFRLDSIKDGANSFSNSTPLDSISLSRLCDSFRVQVNLLYQVITVARIRSASNIHILGKQDFNFEMASYEDNDDYNDCIDSINDKVKTCDCDSVSPATAPPLSAKFLGLFWNFKKISFPLARELDEIGRQWVEHLRRFR